MCRANNESLRPVIPEEERRQFERLDSQELGDLEHKYDAFIDDCFGPGKFRLESRISGLVIFNWKRTGDRVIMNEVRLVERRDLLPAFMKDMGLFFEMDDPGRKLDFSEEACLDLLNGCPVLEVTGGNDLDVAERKCLELLGSI